MKYLLQHRRVALRWSLPVRGAWVEIALRSCCSAKLRVAPRAGSVG